MRKSIFYPFSKSMKSISDEHTYLFPSFLQVLLRCLYNLSGFVCFFEADKRQSDWSTGSVPVPVKYGLDSKVENDKECH